MPWTAYATIVRSLGEVKTPYIPTTDADGGVIQHTSILKPGARPSVDVTLHPMTSPSPWRLVTTGFFGPWIEIVDGGAPEILMSTRKDHLQAVIEALGGIW